MSLASRALVASVLVLLLVSCASISGPSGEPRFNPRSIDSRSSLLPASLQVAAYIEEFEERLTFYEEAVSILLDRDDVEGAEAVVEYVSVLLELREEGRDGAQAGELLLLARLQVAIGQPEPAGESLQRVFDKIRDISAPGTRGPLLFEATDIAFAGGEDTYGILQDLVSAALVTEDLPLRIRLLRQIAEGYASEGAGPAAGTLAQQAIPAAESIDNPWRRGIAFSDVSYIFSVAGDSRNQDQYFRRVLRDMELGRPAVSPEGAFDGLRAVNNFLSFDEPLEALRLTELLPSGSIRARGLADIGLYYGRQDDRPTAFVTFSRAVREAGREVNPLQRASVLRYIAENYIAIEEAQLAELQAMAAVDAVRQATGDEGKPELFRELLPIYARDGELSEVDTLLELLETPLYRGEILAEAAALSSDAGRGDDARRYLREARAALEGIDSPPRQVVIPVAGSTTRLNGVAESLRYLQTLQGDPVIAWGLLESSRYHPPGESLSDESAVLLEELLAAVRANRVAGLAR